MIQSHARDVLDWLIHGPDGHTDEIGDEPHEVVALSMAFFYLAAVVGAPVVYYGSKVTDFFYHPYNWSTFKYEDSPFDVFRKSGPKNITKGVWKGARFGMRFAWYAQLAYSGGSIAYAGYKNGWAGAKKETEEQFLELTFGNIWMRPIDRYVIKPLNDQGYGN